MANSADAQSLRHQRTMCFGFRDQAVQVEPPQIVEACTATISGGIAGTDSDLVYAYLIRGDAYRQMGNAAAAMSDHNRAVELAPRFPPARINRANLRRYSGDLDGAIEDYDAAIRYDREYYQAYLGRARARAELGDAEGAIADFTAALRLDSSLDEAYYERGGLHYAAQRYDTALADYDQAATLDPHDADYLGATCLIRAILNRDLDRALTACEALVAQAPGAKAVLVRAFVRLRRGEFEAAIADYDAVLSSEPNSAGALYGRGVARSRLGQMAESQRDIAAAAVHDTNIASEFASYGITP
jgi:tetratricopeptide (TPR) repeat protein